MMGYKMVQNNLIASNSVHALLNLKNDYKLSISLKFHFFQYTISTYVYNNVVSDCMMSPS